MMASDVSTVRVNGADADLALASVTATVNEYAPDAAAEMVPPSTPAPERERPGGTLPAVTAQPSGAFPPAAEKVKVYGCPGRPTGSGEVEAIAGRAKTAMDSGRVAVTPLASVSVTVKLCVLPVVVPLTVPVAESMDRPAGSVPVPT